MPRWGGPSRHPSLPLCGWSQVRPKDFFGLPYNWTLIRWMAGDFWTVFMCFFPRGLILELYLGGLRIKKYVWCKNELFSGLVGGMISDLQMFSCLKVFLLCCRVSYVAADTSRAIIFQRNDLINKIPGFESGRQQQLMRLPIMKISFERLGRCGSYKMISKWLEILCQRSARCFALCAWVPWGFPSTWNRFWVLFDPKRSEGMLSRAGEENSDLPLPSNGQTLPD